VGKERRRFMVKKSIIKGKEPSINRLKTIKETDHSLLYAKELFKYHNASNKIYNETLGALKRGIRNKILTNDVTQDDLLSYKKEKAKALKGLQTSSQKLLKASPLGQYRVALSRYRVSDTVLRTRDYPPFEVIEQPGTRVVGGTHPCCIWYERSEDANWYATYGPILAPDNKALTQWDSGWIANNKLQLFFEIEGTHDNEYTDAYIGYVYFYGKTNPMPRRGKVSFQLRVLFENADSFVRGSGDWFTSDDYGWVGGYHMLRIDRIRAGASQRIYNTWQNTEIFGATEWKEDFFREATSAITAQGWPGGSNAPWFAPINNIYLNADKDNSNNIIVMESGDVFNFTLGVMFYICAYGDEGALGGVNIRSMYGSASHMEVPPIRINLEECED